MCLFYAAIFFHCLCLANAINFTTVYEWNEFDFAWPSGANSSNGQIGNVFKSNNVYFRYMAVFEERLFLSLDINFGIPATLMWLPTIGTSTAPPKLAPFPSWHLHKKDNCDAIQAVKGVETDTDGRLWALDLGCRKCPSKLWIFNLLNNDTTDRVHQFPDTVVVSHSNNKMSLRGIVLDKTPDDYLAYIADFYSEHIVVYSRKLDKSWLVKTPGREWFSLAISPNREARQSLYLRRYGSKDLYSVFVSELKNEGGRASVQFIGEFNEPPYRMLMDSANVLYAAFFGQNYLSKWNTSEPFHEQKFHEVGSLDTSWPFTFSLDADETLWVMERNRTGGEARHKLLKAAVGARS